MTKNRKPTRVKQTPAPIMAFASINEARASLKEWQARLFLDDWIFGITLEDEIVVDNDNVELAGQIKFDVINKAATIRISPLRKDADSFVLKHAQEVSLVHELLHCKIGWLNAPDTMEGKHWEVCQHILIEEMARSLVMAKYNVGREWFINRSGAGHDY